MPARGNMHVKFEFTSLNAERSKDHFCDPRETN